MQGDIIYIPREVEEVLYEHPGVQEAVVAGIPDPYRGETVKAYIVLKEDASITEEELNAFTVNIWQPTRFQEYMSLEMNCPKQQWEKFCEER